MNGSPNTPLVTPTTGEIIAAYGLNPTEAEAVTSLLKGKDKLQNYWRARAAIQELIKAEERAYYREL